MRVGLTGGVASGKSTVSAILRELGAVVIDADQLAREVVAPGHPGAGRGRRGVRPRRAHRRTASSTGPRSPTLVFGDEAARRAARGHHAPAASSRSPRLEAEAPDGRGGRPRHPAARRGGPRRQLRRRRRGRRPRESRSSGWSRDRGWTEEDARARMAAQASREDRLAVATYVIENTGTLEDLREQVEEVWADLHARQGSGHDEAAPLGARAAASRAGPGGPGTGQAAMSGSARVRSFCSASRSSWRTRSAEMPCLAPMSASLCTRPSTSP